MNRCQQLQQLCDSVIQRRNEFGRKLTEIYCECTYDFGKAFDEYVISIFKYHFLHYSIVVEFFIKYHTPGHYYYCLRDSLDISMEELC